MLDDEAMTNSRLPGHRLPNGCAYCGSPAADSSDHVPPECVFPQLAEFRKDLITVPACTHCNGRHSQDDAFLLIFLSRVPGLLASHVAGSEVADRAARALQRAGVEIKQLFQAGTRPSDLIMREADKRLIGIFRDQVRALHFWVQHERVSAGSRVAVFLVQAVELERPIIKKTVKAALGEIRKTAPIVRGEEAFTLQWARLSRIQEGTGYLLRVYGFEIVGFVVPQASPLGAVGFGQEAGGRIYRFRRSTASNGPLGTIDAAKRRPSGDLPSQFLEGKKLKHQRIEIDDKHFHNCEFVGCHLVYKGGNVPMFTGDIIMDEVKFGFEDAADRTLHMLGRLAIDEYGEEMLRKFIDEIIREAIVRRSAQSD